MKLWRLRPLYSADLLPGFDPSVDASTIIVAAASEKEARSAARIDCIQSGGPGDWWEDRIRTVCEPIDVTSTHTTVVMTNRPF